MATCIRWQPPGRAGIGVPRSVRTVPRGSVDLKLCRGGVQAHAAILNASGGHVWRSEVCDASEAADVQEPRHTASDFDNPVPPQLLQRSIEMDDTQPQGIRDDFLRQWQGHEVVRGETDYAK